MTPRDSSTVARNHSFVRQCGDAWKFFPFQQFERCAAAGRDKSHLVRQAGLFYCGDRIAASDNGRCVRTRQRFRDRDCAGRERGNLENSDRPVPQNRFRLRDFVFVKAIVPCPISTACQPSVIPARRNAARIATGRTRLNFCAVIASAARPATPFSFARSMISRARSSLSASTRLSPIGMPCAFQNVFAIAPPIKIVSAFSISALITPILSETFDPPRMTTNGLAGLSSSPTNIGSPFPSGNPSRISERIW